jgi:hypothetical protein
MSGGLLNYGREYMPGDDERSLTHSLGRCIDVTRP